MPPGGVEKGVSQESPHFSFPEATANDNGEYKEESRAKTEAFIVS